MKSPSGFRNWAEIVGVLGLILSLVFVGYEVRQNTRVAKAEAYRAFVGEVNDWYGRLADPDFAALMGRLNLDGYSSLTAAERLQLFSFGMILFRVYEGLFKEVTEGVIDESALLLLSQSEYDFEWLREIWPEISRNLTPDFVAYAEATHGLRPEGSG